MARAKAHTLLRAPLPPPYSWFGLEMMATRSNFTRNTATGTNGGGGVISLSEGSNLTFTDCEFRENMATHTGGMLLAKDDSHVTFLRGAVYNG